MYHGPLRTTTPLTRINDDLIHDEYSHNLLSIHRMKFEGRNYQDPLIVGSKNSNMTYFNAFFLEKSFVYLITETVSEYPYPYFSEKTWKAMLCKMPFMIIGSQNSLKKLREFGFKTFSKWWSESYDILPTTKERILHIVKNLETLSQLSLSDLESLKKDMSEILDYNYNHIKDFKKTDLENLKNNL